MDIKFKQYNGPKFELVLQIRDHSGNPTGKTKSFVTDSAEELDRYYERNNGMKKVKSRKKKEDKKAVAEKKQEEVTPQDKQ